MAPFVTLTIHGGMRDGEELVFKDRSLCTVGRSDDCDLRVPSSSAFLDISRHHCRFDIDPPSICVRDLGSRNGTFVNDNNIGQRARDQSSADIETPFVSLKDGDRVRIGQIVLGVKISAFEEAACCVTPEEKTHCRILALEKSTAPERRQWR
jgi:eukaryotic-like serine/threonine-protein kinase